MKPRIHICLPALLLTCLSADSQKISKSDKILFANLQQHIQSLAADTAGGRSMGTAGERQTGDFVISELSKTGAVPRGDKNGWLQTFTVDEGRQIGGDALFTVDGQPLAPGREWFPLALSPAGEVSGSPAVALQESGVPWFQDLKEWLESAAEDPAFDLIRAIRTRAATCQKKGATALILYNSSGTHPDKLSFDPKDKSEPAVIPVVYLTRESVRKYFKDESALVDLHVRISYVAQERTGRNVVSLLDNGAATTVMICSRYDNSSGLAGMIELARLLGASKLKGNNYAFVVFSGAGPGARYYAAHAGAELKKVNYLVELDRLGTLNDTLFIGGYGSSATWAAVGNAVGDRKDLLIHYDNSVTQSGDHASFYRKDIPVLIFSTGAGPDLADPVNFTGEMKTLKFIYAMIEGANSRGRLVFTP